MIQDLDERIPWKPIDERWNYCYSILHNDENNHSFQTDDVLIRWKVRWQSQWLYQRIVLPKMERVMIHRFVVQIVMGWNLGTHFEWLDDQMKILEQEVLVVGR
eukprot:2275745-Ditylum_brightwellii.AAC.1